MRIEKKTKLKYSKQFLYQELERNGKVRLFWTIWKIFREHLKNQNPEIHLWKKKCKQDNWESMIKDGFMWNLLRAVTEKNWSLLIIPMLYLFWKDVKLIFS